MLRSKTRVKGGGSAWYKSSAYLLNNVAPTLIHDYASQRYYDTSRGPTAFPLTFTRLSNATMFDSSGNLVWAPANLNAYSTTFGTTGWSINGTPSVTTSIDAPSGFSSSIEMTTTATNQGYFGASVVNRNLISGATYTFSAWVKIISGPLSIRFVGGANTIDVAASNEWTRVSGNVTSTSTVPAVYSTGAAVLRIAGIQIELASVDTPKAFIETSGLAYYGPRFDYDPLTLVPRGILIEESKTNIQPISMGVTSDWTANFSTITNAGATILGNTAYTFTTIATSGQFAFITANPGALAASTLYTSSIRVKKGNHSRVQFTVTNNCFQPTAADAYANYNFDTDTLTVLGSSLPAPTGTRTLCSDGSVIISLTYTTGTVPVAGASGIVCCVDTDAAVRLAGTTTNGATVHVLGIQCEAGAFVSSYIPTSGVSATRAEETFSISTSGWITSNTGAMFAQFSQPYVDSTSSSHGVATTDGLARWIYTIQGTVRAYDGTTIRVGPAYTENTQMKAVLALIGGNMRQSVNGAAVGVSVFDGTMTPDATLKVGSQFGPNTKLNGWVKEIRYYPAGSPSDAQLQALTA